MNRRFLTLIELQKLSQTGKGSVPSFKTKGDNNQIEDEYTVAAADIVAKYNSKISGLGKAVDLLETQKGFFICIVLPLILFFLYQLYHFIKVIVTVKQENVGLSKEDEEELKKKAVEEYLAKQKEEQEASEEK